VGASGQGAGMGVSSVGQPSSAECRAIAERTGEEIIVRLVDGRQRSVGQEWLTGRTMQPTASARGRHERCAEVVGAATAADVGRERGRRRTWRQLWQVEPVLSIAHSLLGRVWQGRKRCDLGRYSYAGWRRLRVHLPALLLLLLLLVAAPPARLEPFRPALCAAAAACSLRPDPSSRIPPPSSFTSLFSYVCRPLRRPQGHPSARPVLRRGRPGRRRRFQAQALARPPPPGTAPGRPAGIAGSSSSSSHAPSHSESRRT
jgi:hypothetical protein